MPPNNFKDLSGSRFQRWLVLSSSGVRTYPRGATRRTWLCRCDCGTERSVDECRLRNGTSGSCGCYHRERVSRSRPLTHGDCGSVEYHTWSSMISRCENPKNKQYKDYGGRGIFICDRWRKSYEAFLADMGRRPQGHTLDRIDNEQGYGPANCRWATRLQQMANTRRARMLTINGVTLHHSAWAKRYGIDPRSFHQRMKRGWDPIRALGDPPDLACDHQAHGNP